MRRYPLSSIFYPQLRPSHLVTRHLSLVTLAGTVMISDSPDALDQQIAALEAALQLPLPEDTRQRLMADLHMLRDQWEVHAGAALIQSAGDTHGIVEIGGGA